METVLFIYASVILAAIAIPTYWLARTFVRRKRLMCPEKKRVVHVQFVCRGSHRNLIPLRVKSCTAFKNPRKVECDARCMSMLTRTGGTPKEVVAS